ncbi:MAG: hypothetical protein M0Q13_11960 [Methanothrix sp.]|jgi:hypothetical protein|nr:hypothetical protein [Methanothrix sp.]
MSVKDRLAVITGEAVPIKDNNERSEIIIPTKYILIEDDRCKLGDGTNTILYRIKSLKAFGDIPANTILLMK